MAYLLVSCGNSLTLYILMMNLVGAVCQHDCPLWHIYSKEKKSCECCSPIDGLIRCEEDYIHVARSYCLTWNNATYDVQISRCLYIHQDTNLCKNYNRYAVSSDTVGPELNNMICEPYNRYGAQCQYCMDGYGPAAFSDGATCADCSRYKYLWLLNLTLQLMVVTLMYLVVILFQTNGTCSPFNIITTNCQLGLNAMMIVSGFHNRLICITNKTFAKIALTLIGGLNLDFFCFVIPPLCISTALKPVHTLLFDYIIAVYPILVTAAIYVAIELYDRNCRIIVLLSSPFRLFWCRNWRPKETILCTCATFLLLSYSKFLFVSISLLFNVSTYACSGEAIPNSSVLLYDPSIKFLSSEHIPYVILALSATIIFILFPPLLLLLYPTKLFRKFLSCCGFRRWDILHLVMDVFQGWYKDGTEGTYDYRPLSAIYMILRIAFCLAYFKLLVSREHILFGAMVGVLYALLGMLFLAFKPYKVNWMNISDGNIFLFLAFFSMTYALTTKVIYYIGIVSGLSITLVIGFCLGYKCLRKFIL